MQLWLCMLAMLSNIMLNAGCVFSHPKKVHSALPIWHAAIHNQKLLFEPIYRNGLRNNFYIVHQLESYFLQHDPMNIRLHVVFNSFDRLIENIHRVPHNIVHIEVLFVYDSQDDIAHNIYMLQQMQIVQHQPHLVRVTFYLKEGDFVRRTSYFVTSSGNLRVLW